MLLGRYKQAIQPIKRWLLRYPGILWAHAWLAYNYSFVGDDDAARAEAAQVERAVAVGPKSAAGQWALALTLNSLWKPAEALVAADTAIRLDPQNSVSCIFERGRAYTLLGLWQEAIPAFKAYAARYPDDFWSHAYLAMDYTELGHDDAARAEVAEALGLNPQFTVDTVFPTAGLQHKANPAEIDRFRADLHKAGMN